MTDVNLNPSDILGIVWRATGQELKLDPSLITYDHRTQFYMIDGVRWSDWLKKLIGTQHENPADLNRANSEIIVDGTDPEHNGWPVLPSEQ